MRASGRWAAAVGVALFAGFMSGSPAAAVPAPAQAAGLASVAYTITDLGTLPGGDLTVATGINNAGVVVGYATTSGGAQRGFRWTNGVMTDLGTLPGGGDSRANAINDAGQVAGTGSRSSGGYGYPVRWSRSGAIQDLGGPLVNALGVGNAIDPAGRVAGGQRPASSEANPEAMLYEVDGHAAPLGSGLGAATGINARDQVVGGPGFIWQNGVLTELPPLSGGVGNASTTAFAINVRGQVAGGASLNGVRHAALWQNGVAVDLGVLDGIQYNQGTAINAAGEAVGTSDPLCYPCVSPRAWRWRPGGALTPLDTLIPAGSGWTLREATGINDRGQIVGRGLHDGHVRGYLLTPAFHANINFAPAGAEVPVGYAPDTGAIFGARSGGLSYGWDVDNSANARDRNSTASADQRYDTLNHLQKPGGGRRWEVAVPNGAYLVHVVAGDASNTDSAFRLDVEGTEAAAGRPTSAAHWVEDTVRVTVTDGRLSVGNAGSASNNKICYLDVISD